MALQTQTVPSDTIMLTQNSGRNARVRRTATEVANTIEAMGAIIGSRGVIKMTALDALRAMACECYETLREQTSVS